MVGALDPTRDWYARFYRATKQSRAHALYCQHTYGRDLCQSGYATMQQIDDLIGLAHLDARRTALDVGCGTGMITEYLSDVTQARLWGIDYIPEAIAQACERTAAKRERLTFTVGDMAALYLPPEAFDVIISFDTLYFSDLDATIGQLRRALKPRGQLLIYHNLLLWHEDEDRSQLLPDRTPLGEALQRQRLTFTARDYTAEEHERSLRSRRAATALRAAFEREGNLPLYENRMMEAEGNIRLYEAGRMRRYLYQARE